jgi:CRISPR-associated protein Cas1
MEELRAPLCDRLALTLFNRGQLTPADFESCSGACTMNDRARKLVISSWQARKKEIILHPFLKEKLEIGLIPPYAGEAASPCLARGS